MLSRGYVESISLGHFTLPFGNTSAVELAKALLAADDALKQIANRSLDNEGYCLSCESTPYQHDAGCPSLTARAAMLPSEASKDAN